MLMAGAAVSPSVHTISHAAQSTDVHVEERRSEVATAAVGADGTYRRLWPASLAFARYLCAHPELVRGKRVVELGAGSGAIGLVCAALGAASVCITDVPGALQPICDNVRRNPSLSGRVHVLPCMWGSRPHIDALLQQQPCGFDAVVACEVIYKQAWPVLAALLDTMDTLLDRRRGAQVVLGYRLRASIMLEDAAFFGPAAERFVIQQETSLRPYEEREPVVDAGTAAADDDDDGRLQVYRYVRAVVVRDTSPTPQSAAAPANEELSALLSRLGLAHLSVDALCDAGLDELAQAVLDDRPALLKRLRAGGIERLADRQKVANELTRAARARGLSRRAPEMEVMLGKRTFEALRL
jgi:predicted nicotinamide N-methyase